MPAPTIGGMTIHLTDLAIRPGAQRVWTAGELRRQGWSHERIAEARRHGDLTRLLRGVYLEGEELTFQRRVVAALKYLDQRVGGDRTPACVSGDTGLAAHGVLPEPDGPPLVLVDARSHPRLPHGFFDTVRHTLRPDQLVRKGHLRMAPLMRCLVDADHQERVDDASLRHAVDAIRLQLRWTMPDIVRGWRAAGGNGALRLEAMLAAGTFEQESDGERDCFAQVFGVHPPSPDCQVLVLGRLRADFVFISAGVIVEYHGQAEHADRVQEDATRVRALEAAGWRVIVVTAAMLRDASALAHQIHTIRRSREQLIAAGALPHPRLPIQPERLSPLRTIHAQG